MIRLRWVRLLKGRTQHQLMKETGINFATLSRIERGWLKPTDEQKRKLADALKVKASWLFPKEANNAENSNKQR